LVNYDRRSQLAPALFAIFPDEYPSIGCVLDAALRFGNGAPRAGRTQARKEPASPLCMYDPAWQDIPTMEGRQILRAARAERRKGEGRRRRRKKKKEKKKKKKKKKKEKEEKERKKRRSAVGSLATP